MQPQKSHCEREAEVVRAAQRAGGNGSRRGNGSASTGTSEPDASVRAHLQTCAACREAFDTARFMTRLAAETDAMAATRELPEPGQLWWKARLLQRWEAETRATAPLDWMQRVEVIAGLIAAAVLLVMIWSDMRGAESSAHASRLLPAIASLLAPGALSSFIVGGLLLVGCVALFTLRQLLTED
jgi:predicted anti-sigma-YlaC factor YlaD